MKALVIVVALCSALLLFVGGGIASYFFFKVREDQGTAPRTISMPKLCQTVSKETLTKIRTTNPNELGTREALPFGDERATSCSWSQTAGQDGKGSRYLEVLIEQTKGTAQSLYHRRKETETALASTRPLDNGQRAIAWRYGAGGHVNVIYIAHSGDNVVSIEYGGWDPGLLSRTRPDTNELEATAKTVAEEVLGKL